MHSPAIREQAFGQGAAKALGGTGDESSGGHFIYWCHVDKGRD
jgi:hypothetical protein